VACKELVGLAWVVPPPPPPTHTHTNRDFLKSPIRFNHPYLPFHLKCRWTGFLLGSRGSGYVFIHFRCPLQAVHKKAQTCKAAPESVKQKYLHCSTSCLQCCI